VGKRPPFFQCLAAGTALRYARRKKPRSVRGRQLKWSGATWPEKERKRNGTERNGTSKGKGRPFSQVEEAGGAPDGVAHAAEVAALERAADAFHHRRRRGGAPRGHLVRRHHGLAVIVTVVGRGLQQLRFPAAPVRRRLHRLGPGRHGDGSRAVVRLRGALLLLSLRARDDGDGRGGRRPLVVVVGEQRGQPHAARGEVAGGRRGDRPPQAGGRGRRGGRRGRGGRAGGGGPDDVALVELQLLGAGVVGLLEQAEEAEGR
jgi:hypothetical protein